MVRKHGATRGYGQGGTATGPDTCRRDESVGRCADLPRPLRYLPRTTLDSGIRDRERDVSETAEIDGRKRRDGRFAGRDVLEGEWWNPNDGYAGIPRLALDHPDVASQLAVRECG